MIILYEIHLPPCTDFRMKYLHLFSMLATEILIECPLKVSVRLMQWYAHRPSTQVSVGTVYRSMHILDLSNRESYGKLTLSCDEIYW